MALSRSTKVPQPNNIKALVVEFVCTAQMTGNTLVGQFFVAIAHALLVIVVMISVGFKISEYSIHRLAVGMDSLQGVVMEIVLIFSLVLTVYATMVDPKEGFLYGQGPILTGFVVGPNIMAGGAISGASMNPARSFGPAVVTGIGTDQDLLGWAHEKFFIFRSSVIFLRDEENFN